MSVTVIVPVVGPVPLLRHLNCVSAVCADREIASWLFAIVTSGETVLVMAKTAGVTTPVTVAFTLYAPPVALAVNVGAVATPLAFVVTIAVNPPFVPPVNVPLAPLAGAVNVTEAPLTRFPPLSFTVACNAVAKAIVTGVLCGVPAVAVMLAGDPTRLVSENAAGAGRQYRCVHRIGSRGSIGSEWLQQWQHRWRLSSQ